MKQGVVFIMAVAFLFSCQTPVEQEEEKVYTISEFLLDADMLDSTVVQVKGMVDHLCMGSRAKIHFVCPEDTDESIKIFAGEEMGEFSDTLQGQMVVVKGLVSVSTRIDEAYLTDWEAELEEGADHHHHGDEEGEAEEHHHHHGDEVEEPETHHHGNQVKLIAKYRKMIQDSGKGYINLYKITVTEIRAAE